MEAPRSLQRHQTIIQEGVPMEGGRVSKREDRRGEKVLTRFVDPKGSADIIGPQHPHTKAPGLPM